MERKSNVLYMILSCDKVILPGVGSFGDAMGKLREYKLDHGDKTYPVQEFLMARLWDGRTFWEAESEMEWVDY